MSQGTLKISVWALEKTPVPLPRVCEGSLIKESLGEIVFGFEGSLSEGSTEVDET